MTDHRAEFEWYADWASDVSPLYERLARGIAETPDLLDIAAEAPGSQPTPQLLLGAVHALLLSGVEHPLAAHYPTRPDAAAPEAAAPDLVPAFRDFCLAYEDRLREIVATRRVQTNEVGRAAVLLPAFEYVARAAADRPLALIEIGASAGLNLRWDRFRYEYGDAGTYGVADSPVTIDSAVRGAGRPPFPESLPAVCHRVGNDLHPLDVTDPADARWLRALVIPDQRERHERLVVAIELARREPPELVAGDALEVLPDLLRDVPADATCCVYSTLTLYQFAEGAVADLRALLADHSRRRPIYWLSGDPAVDRDHPTYRCVELVDGSGTATRLAAYESYGAWIRWLRAED